MASLMAQLGEFDLSEIAEARHELELMCARLAGERREQQHLDAMAREIKIQKQEGLSDTAFVPRM